MRFRVPQIVGLSIPEHLVANDPLVELKLSLLDAATPAQDAIVFGDVWGVHGAYSQRLADLGCDPVWVIDVADTEEFERRRAATPSLLFEQGDFSNPFYMSELEPVPELGVAFDVLLHQGPLITTVHLILDHCQRAICIAQPMMKEQNLPNALVYLPGSPNAEELVPSYAHIEEDGRDVVRAGNPEHVNPAYWLWGMTRSFLVNLLVGEGFEITTEERGPDLDHPNWYLWGCVAERRRANPLHWSDAHPYPTRDPS